MKPWYSLLVGLFLSSAIAVRVKAQITVDGTTNTNLTPTDDGVRIERGNRAEGNLFHSFSEFSVLKGTEAFFNNPNDIVNIFSRVTGGNISNIDGVIRANGTANLFLINPAGIIFGEGASLNIGGSFLGSTAESLVFADGEFLATDGDNTPLLTINMPIGLNLGNNLGQIVNKSVANNGNGLEVVPGENITLVGGNVNLDGGRIFAGGGRVELGGLSAAGKIGINADGSLRFPEGIARADVTLTNAADVNVQAAGGGSIGINVRNLELSGVEGASILRAGIAPESNSPKAQAGDINLNVTGNITVNQGSSIRNRVEESGVGNSGGIDITTANLFLQQGGRIRASTLGKGNSGAITIKASDTISADGETQARSSSGIVSRVRSGAMGDSGNVDITTTNLYLTQGGRISATIFGKGDAGAITIKASGTISADGNSGIFSQVRGEGNSGGININTANLSLTQGGRVSATTFGKGNAGAITIEASGTISLNGEDQDGSNSSIFSQVAKKAIGNSGEIKISTANLSLTQGGLVDASTLGKGDAGAITIEASDTISADGEDQAGFKSGIFSQVKDKGEGNSGGMNITTANLSLTQGGQVSSSTVGQGNAGEINIKASGIISADGSGNILNEEEIQNSSGIFSTAGDQGKGDAADININTNSLSLINNAEISVRSLGQGTAKNILIQANSLTLSNKASLFASTSVGTGGNITLDIADVLTLRNNSTISARALEDANGGNIDIDANFVIAFPNQNSDIIASAAQGTGGNIDIATNAIFGIEERSSDPRNETNDLDASSQFGLDGTIEINELDLNPAEGLQELPTEVIDVTRLVAQNLCKQAKDSEFIITGKGGIAPDPSQVRDGEVIEVDLVEPAPFLANREDGEVGEDREVGEEIVEAQGWIINDRGYIELIAYKTDLHGSPAQPKNVNICNN